MKKLRVSFSTLETYYRTLSHDHPEFDPAFHFDQPTGPRISGLQERPAEGRCRWGSASGHRGYDPSLAPVYPGMDKTQVSELIKETRKLSHEYDSYTQFKERFANGKYVNVDPNGFRNRLRRLPWPPDPKALNIFVFGGSTTFGYRVADYDTIPSHLQELIRKEMDLPAAIYNFGRGG